MAQKKKKAAFYLHLEGTNQLLTQLQDLEN